MKILVTGAAGLIGSHTCDKLLANGHTVVGIDNMSYGNLDNLENAINSDNFTFVNIDCTTKFWDLSLTDECEVTCDCDMGKFDFIYHFASLKKLWEGEETNSSDILDINFDMTRQVVKKAIEDGSHLIFASTSDVYGNHNTFLESDPISIGPSTVERYSYSMSKLHSEQYILNFTKKNILKSTIIRIFGCASRRSPKSLFGMHLALFTYNMLNDIDITIHNDGNQTRAVSHAEDVADGFCSIIPNSESVNGEIINLGTDQQTTINYVANYIKERIDTKSNILHTPIDNFFKDYPEIKVRFANLDKAKKLLNYKVKHTTEQVMDELIKEWKND
tara:strand:- start:3150 stop:4145 length:996 start_codon:yes stop_codon:yes gene_type:complete